MILCGMAKIFTLTKNVVADSEVIASLFGSNLNFVHEISIY